MHHKYSYPDDGKVDMVGELCRQHNIKPLTSTGGGGIRALAKKIGATLPQMYELMSLDTFSNKEEKSELLKSWLTKIKEGGSGVQNNSGAATSSESEAYF